MILCIQQPGSVRGTVVGACGLTRGAARGFTLTEMLVVIGIIVLVLGIATPMVTRAWRAGDRARTQADLAAIASALEAYRQDHADYPQIAPPPAPIDVEYNGARMLYRALIGPGPQAHPEPAFISDGKGPDLVKPDPLLPGPGFRTRGTSGRVYGPYLKPEQFKFGDPSGREGAAPGHHAFLDRYNKPILYYRAVGKPNIRLDKGYVWYRGDNDKPLYNASDNWNPGPQRGAMSRETLSHMLGDSNNNGRIDEVAALTEIPAHEGPFLLWSTGPDEIFGPPPGLTMSNVPQIRKAVEKSDDITNFRN
jgi:prepilin-type N-terminal cleavage/methylation domain-containing protein